MKLEIFQNELVDSVETLQKTLIGKKSYEHDSTVSSLRETTPKRHKLNCKRLDVIFLLG